MSFAVIYRWTVAPEHEDYFRRRWHDGTLRYRELGGLGSLLARDEGGAFVAIALWCLRRARPRRTVARHLVLRRDETGGARRSVAVLGL
jgi:hypothetical protein